MPGQPQVAGILEFDVSNLEVSAEPSPGPLNIVPVGEDFTLTATFGATPGGIWWNEIKDDAEAYNGAFYAEGWGVAAGDIDLGDEPGNFGAPDTYTQDHVVSGGIAQPGVYKMACVVTLPGVPGVVGYYDGLVVQVY